MKSPIVIVVHHAELDHPEQTGMKIVRTLMRHSKDARFTIVVPEREYSPITSGGDIDEI